MQRRIPLFLALALAAFGANAAPATYTIDPGHTDVIATWNHFGFSTPSLHLGDAKGTITFDALKPANSRVDVELPLSAMNTHVAKLDAHLAGKDFFEKDKYPAARFKSLHVVDHGKGHLEIHGALTVHGVTKPVTLHAQLNKAAVHPMSKQPTIGFNATGTLKRSDFGLGMAVPAVSDEVKLTITTEAAVAK